MKMKLDKMGFGAYEFLSVAVVCLLLSCILLLIILGNSNAERFQVFCYDAKIMALNAVTMEYRNGKDTVYLYEMIDDGLISPIKNPFASREYCNPYESKVEFLSDDRRVTLQCGNYLVYQESLKDDSYSIYRVNDWSSSSSIGESKIVYNYMVSNKLVFSDYYEEDLFLSMVNRSLNTSFSSIKEVQSEYKVVSKKVYRNKKLIKEISY